MAIHLRTDHPFVQDFKKRRELEALELDLRLAGARRKSAELFGPPQRTGAPGRPKTSSDLALRLFAERAKAGQHAGSLAAEARVIGVLIRKAGAAPLKDGYIENVLRKKYDKTWRRPKRSAAKPKTTSAKKKTAKTGRRKTTR